MVPWPWKGVPSMVRLNLGVEMSVRERGLHGRIFMGKARQVTYSIGSTGNGSPSYGPPR